MSESIKLPVISIMIATYNSGKILPLVLESINNQSYPRELIEILAIDGGSSDNTIDIAKKYGCIVLHNPKTEPVNAKLIGASNATGKYLMTLDHDEVLKNKDDILIRIKAMEENKVKMSFCSGYMRPNTYPLLNQFISEFGDSFSLFMYNLSKDYFFQIKTLKRRYTILKENEEYIIVTFKDMKKKPIYELVAGGAIFNLECAKTLANVTENGQELVHLFYVFLSKGEMEVVISKNTPLEHYSVDSLKAYLPKIKWRVCNNIHFVEHGMNGFNGRDGNNVKKYLFPLYSILLPVTTIHAGYLAISRKNVSYLLHPFFCLYLTYEILVQYFMKILGKKPSFKSYDGKKVIEE